MPLRQRGSPPKLPSLLVGRGRAWRRIAEFLATDDHEQTGESIAIIKDGTARMYDLPEDYSVFRVETYRDRVDKPHSYNKLGIVAGKDDVEAMLGHTYIQR